MIGRSHKGLAAFAALACCLSSLASDHVVSEDKRVEGSDLVLIGGRVLIMSEGRAMSFELGDVDAFGFSVARDLVTTAGEKLAIESAKYADGRLVVRSKSLGDVALPLDAVESILFSGARLRYAEAFGGFVTASGALMEPHGWKGTLGLSFVQSRGLTRSRTFSASANAARVDGPYRTTLAAQYSKGSAEGVTATDIARAEAKLDRFVSLRAYAYGTTLAYRDGVADISPRIALGAGGGYRFLGGPRHELSAEAGYEFLAERVGGAPFDESSFARLAGGYALNAGAGRVFTEKVELGFSISGERRLRARSESALSLMLNDRLSLRIGFTIEHDTAPPAVTPRTTSQAETALVLSF